MNTKTRVSFCALFYNQEQYVEQTIMGMINQDYDSYEIIIRDDCSSDKTQQKIKEILGNINSDKFKIKVDYGTVNLGIVGSINRTLELSEGDIIVLQGGDDISMPSRLSESTRLIEKYNVDLVACDATLINERNQLLRPSFYLKDADSLNKLINDPNSPKLQVESNILRLSKINETVLGFQCYGGFGICFKRSLLDFYNGFLPLTVKYEDRLLSFLANVNRGSILYISPLVSYRRTGSNISFTIDENINNSLNKLAKIISMEMEVCQEQISYIENGGTVNNNYSSKKILDYLYYDLYKNMLVMKSLKYREYTLSKTKIILNILKIRGVENKKKIKVILLYISRRLCRKYLLKLQRAREISFIG
jgi:glycosyltransferase involved in cell wall biosynthesis